MLELDWSGFWIGSGFAANARFGVDSGIGIGFELYSEWMLDSESILDWEWIWIGFGVDSGIVWIGRGFWILFWIVNGFGVYSGVGNIWRGFGLDSALGVDLKWILDLKWIRSGF